MAENLLIDLSAEARLLSAILRDPASIDSYGENFRPDLFTDPDHIVLAVALIEWRRVNPAGGKAALEKYLAGLLDSSTLGADAIDVIIQTPPGDAQDWGKLCELRQRRLILEACQKTIAQVERGDVTAVKMFAEHQQALQYVVSASPSGIEAKQQDVAQAVVVCLADVAPEPIRWYWPDRIAIGKLTVLAGDPGLGKSFLTIDMAARTSIGAPWPDIPDIENPAGGVVLLNCEDDLADTIRPRLDRAGADCSRIVALQGVEEPAGDGKPRTRAFRLDRDLPRLEAAIDQCPGCRLVVIDPITGYLGEADSHKNAEIRALLSPLSELASRRGVAVVAVSHLNKGAGGPAIYRTMGSLAFVAAARAAWAVTRDKDDATGERRLFLPVKNNIGPDRTGLAYRIAGGAIAWDPDPVTVSADEAMAPNAGDGKPGPEPEALDEAVKWLRELLADGPMLAKDVYKHACDCGVSGGTLNRAKREADVETYRPKNPGPWWWRLPGSTLPSPTTLVEPDNLDNLPVNKGDGAHSHPPHSQVAESDNLPPVTLLGKVLDKAPRSRPIDPGMRPQAGGAA